MSEKGFWKARPKALEVYEARVREAEEKNFELLAEGISFTATVLGVFGVCLGNIELLCTALAMLMLARYLR